MRRRRCIGWWRRRWRRRPIRGGGRWVRRSLPLGGRGGVAVPLLWVEAAGVVEDVRLRRTHLLRLQNYRRA